MSTLALLIGAPLFVVMTAIAAAVILISRDKTK